MNFIIVSSGSYPNGGAATNRHLAYAKGLLELGHKIEFILLKKQQWNENEIFDQGIKFTSVWSNKRNELSKIEKIKSLYYAIKKAKQIVASVHANNDDTILILLDTSINTLIPLLYQAKKSEIRVYHERTEYPFVVGRKTLLSKIDLYIYLKYVIHKFDGIYVINYALKKYFSELTKNKVKVSILNMIVDPSRFEIIKKQSDQIKIISYCGSIEGDKDGILILIEAFSLIADEFPSAQLQLISSSVKHSSLQRILSITNELGITNRVKIVGPFKRNEIPRLLCDSNILALARPNNIQAEGGFPTKLGEYLATGNPVVITNVGEIGRFLKDGLNAFIAEPDNAVKFASKLREALISSKAKMIGIEGKKLVYTEFNYLIQAKTLEKMFEKKSDN